MDSVLAQVILPMVLSVIMFGMGLSLTRDDFVRLLHHPKVVALGLLGQIIFLPMMAFAIATLFELPPAMAIGLMIISVCPSGTTSNMFSHAARANVALSVSLTAFSTIICIFTTPLIIKLSITHFEGVVPTSFSILSTTLGLIFITLLPVSLGIAVRSKWHSFAERAEPIFRRVSIGFLVLMISAIVIKDRDNLGAALGQVITALLTLNLLSVAMGLVLGKLGRCRFDDMLTLGFEVGIQNGSVAILIAVTFLGKTEYATSAGIYGVAMYVGAFLLTGWAIYYRKTALSAQA